MCFLVNLSFVLIIFDIIRFHTVPNFPGKMVSLFVMFLTRWLAVGLMVFLFFLLKQVYLTKLKMNKNIT